MHRAVSSVHDIARLVKMDLVEVSTVPVLLVITTTITIIYLRHTVVYKCDILFHFMLLVNKLDGRKWRKLIKDVA